MAQTQRSFKKEETISKQKTDLIPYKGIIVPGIGYEATCHAREERTNQKA